MRGAAEFGASGDPDWVPGKDVQERSRLLAAMRRWGVESLEALHARSIDDPEWFWRAVVEDLGIDFSSPFERVRDESEGKPFPKWFIGGKINAASLCVHRHAVGPLAGKDAVI